MEISSASLARHNTNYAFFYFRKLETNLKATVDEIAQVETMIRNLKDAIWEKDAPNKVLYQNLCPSVSHLINILL